MASSHRMAEPQHAPNCLQLGIALIPVSGSSRPLVSELTMSDSHPPFQTCYSLCIENIPDHSVRLDLVEAPSRATCNDTRCILPTTLRYQQAVLRYVWLQKLTGAVEEIIPLHW
jgi:hypothetical protein